MKRNTPTLLSCLLLIVGLVLIAAQPAAAMPDGSSRTSFFLQPNGSRWDIYTPFPTPPVDYRTSPSVLRDASAPQYDRFDCGPGADGTIQVIRSSNSPDGHTWSTPVVALKPTALSFDAGGVCDPSVVQTGGFYYMAYTGLYGVHHALFVARTTSLSQPWQKWNGQGWGGPTLPAPIVSSDPGTGFGVGQPSLVVQSGQLQIYYESHMGANWQTRLASAPLGPDNTNTWPSQIALGGVVLRHPGADSTGCGGFYDSTSVAYDDVRHEYVAVTVDNQDYATSSVQTYESASGTSFTKALTLSPLGTNYAVPDHAHNLSLVTNAAGHLTSANSASLVYGYGGSDCPVKLAWQDASVGAAKTGWISTLTPTAKAVGWSFDNESDWHVTSTGGLSAKDLLGAPIHAYFGSALTGSSATIDLDYQQQIFPTNLWSELSFGQHATSGGYTVRVYAVGIVELYSTDADHPLASGSVSGSAQFYANHLQVVLSGNSITVYNGLGGGSLLSPVLQYSSPRDLGLAGGLALGSDGNSGFNNLTVRDDVPASYRSQDDTVLDWKPTVGDWKVRPPSSLFSYLTNGGEIFLQGNAAPVANYNAHLGDGTYTATVQLNPGSPPLSWGGLDITNAGGQVDPDWASGGYLVFIRANGSLGLYRAGSGQVGSDIPTGLNPVTTPVTLTVVKTAGNLQVYVNHNPLPTLVYTDRTASPYLVGTFGVATEQGAGVITNVSYSGTYKTAP